MGKSKLSNVVLRQMVLHRASESITKELDSVETQLKNANEELRKYDPARHTEASGRNKQAKVSKLRERRAELEDQFTTVNEMLKETKE